MGGIPIHQRFFIVQNARNRLRSVVTDWMADETEMGGAQLTTAELFSVLADVLADAIGGTCKYLIRAERHGDLEKKGDEA